MLNTTPRNRIPLITLFITSLISTTGDMMAAIAIPWFVLETTGSTVQTGIAAFFTVSPIVIGMAFGGTLVDRLGYKRVSVVADLASGLTILLIPVLHTTVGLAFWQLLLLVFIGNLLDAPGRSARQSMLPELADLAGISIERATGLSESLNRATTMMGAPIAGLLIAYIGATGVLVVDALTFGLSSFGVLLFIPMKLFLQNQSESENSYWQDLREGYGFVRKDSLILTLIVVMMVTNMIDYAWSAVTHPVYMRTLFGEDNGIVLLGILVGIFGASSFISGLLFSWRGDRIPNHPRFLAIIYCLIPLRFLVFATFAPFEALIIAYIFSGLMAGPINPILSTIAYRRIPDKMRGRVFGIMSSGVLVAMPLGGLIGGFLAEWLSLEMTLVAYTAIYLLATGSLLFNRHLQATSDAEQPHLIVR